MYININLVALFSNFNIFLQNWISIVTVELIRNKKRLKRVLAAQSLWSVHYYTWQQGSQNKCIAPDILERDYCLHIISYVKDDLVCWCSFILQYVNKKKHFWVCEVIKETKRTTSWVCASSHQSTWCKNNNLKLRVGEIKTLWWTTLLKILYGWNASHTCSTQQHRRSVQSV